MAIGTYISIITLNVSGLNDPTKRHRLAEWIQKQDPYICCVTRNPLQTSRHIQTECERKYIFHAKGKQNKAGVAIFISDKIDLKEDYKR